MKTYIHIALSLLLSFIFNFSNAQTPNWKILGPIPFPTTTGEQVHGIGRVSQIKFHPTDPNKMYCVSASGGLFKSTDKGLNWTVMGTDQVAKTQSASIAIDPTNDQVIYWGTGDANNYGGGLGVYKSTNGGASWTLSNTGMGNQLVVEMLFLPTDHNTIIAATSNGVYKSTNAGATWTQKSTQTGLRDLCFKPGSNGQVVYTSASNAFLRSTDAGETWTKITSPAFVFAGGITKIDVSAANPQVVYVANYGASYMTEIYRSTDAGLTFTSMRNPMDNQCLGCYDANSANGGQAWHNFDVCANPANADEIYTCAQVIWRSIDGGYTWTKQQASWAWDLHTDQHHILFDPYVSGQLWNANDGGVFSNTANGTGPWANKSDGIAATEIYHGATSETDRKVSYIGTQDNGGFYYNNGTFYNNRGGDYGPYMWFDYSGYYYDDNQGNSNYFPTGTGVNLNLPATTGKKYYSFTPANTNIGYLANAGTVYRCTNLTSATPSWTLIYTAPSGNITDIQVDAGNADRLYIFTNTPALYRSDNATTTASFVQVTLPTTTTKGSIAPIPNSNIVYLGQGSSIYRSADKGATWTATSGFPSVSVTKIIADHRSTNEAVYACYSLGVYYKDNTKPSWVNYASGLPVICGITDMDIFNDGISQGELNVYYYGRGVWRSNLAPPPNNISVALTSPANNSTYTSPAIINLSATASTTSGNISKVEFYNGTTLLGTSTSAPYTYSWSGVSSGTYGITAVAYDNLGNKASSSLITVTVNFVCNQVTGAPFGTAPYSAGNEFDKAFDGNTSTFFDASSGSTGYTGLDLGTAKVVTSIRYYPRASQTGRMTGGIFQASNVADFSSGVVDLYTIPAKPSSAWQSVTIPNSTAYRYYRYLSPANGFCNVAEIEFCGLNTPPTVSITAPANNATYPSVPATVNITATAADADGTISKVEFYQGTTLLSSDATSPYAFSWTGVTTGTYQLTAKAYDNLSATGTSSVITIIVGNQSPAVAIITPDNNATYANPASITMYATASDPDGTITKVEFYNGATLLGTSTTSPYTYTWTGVPIGTYTLTAKAYDNNGAVSSSSPITVNVIFICTELSGTAFGTTPYAAGNEFDKAFDGNITTYFDASAYSTGYTGIDLGTAKVVSGVRYCPMPGQPYSMAGGKFQGSNTSNSSGFVDLYTIPTQPNQGWNVATISNGTPFRYLRYLSSPGGWGQIAEIEFCGTPNVPPTVSITTPLNNATYSAPATVNVTASASDADGTISKVEYYIGASLMSTSTTSPYTYNMTGLGAGTYTLIAKAYDNNGAVVSSSPVTFTVTNFTTPTITYNGASKVYGDVPFAMTATSNSPGAMTYSIATGGSFASINATSGQVTILGAGTVTVQVNQVANGSYSAGTATATLTIAKKVLTVTADNKSKAFNTVNPALTITYSGFAYTDNAASLTTQATATTTALTASPAGPYPITPAGAVSNNYTFTYVNGTLTINPAAPSISFANLSKIYGDVPFAMTATSNSAGALTYSIITGGSFASINATSGQVTILGAGSVTVQVAQAANGSYAAATQTATLTIAKKVLTVTADNKSKAFNTVNPALTITYSGFAYSDNAASLTTQATATTTALTASPAGPYPITPAGAASNNYTFTYVNGTLTINPAAPSISFANLSKIYGDVPFAMTASSNLTGALTYSIITGGSFASINATSGQVTILGAGSVTVQVAQAANGSYTASTATATLTIAKKVLTVTADNKSKAFNTVNPALTITYSGFAYSDNAASLTTQATATTTALTASPAGPYPITPAGAASNNYTFTYVNGTLTINPASSPTITFNGASKVYGDVPFAMTASSNSAGALTYSIITGGSFASINATSGQVTILGAGSVTVQVAQAANGSYTAGTATATLTIAKKVLTVTADNKSKAFNTVNPALTITYSGFAYSDNAASLTTQATATTTALTASPAGPYPITPAGAASNNYTFTYVNGTLTINPASAPTITFNGASKVYGDVPFAMTATSNSAGALTYSIAAGGSFASINATSGQVTILGAGSVTVQVDQVANGSYTVGTATATLIIAKKVLTVTADNKSKAFNTVNPALTITYSGFAYSDNAASLTTQATATTTALTASPAGPYPITPAGAASNNYTFTYVNGTLTINPASAPTIAFNGASKVYGDVPFAMTATSNSAGALTYSIAAGGSFASINATSGQVTILGAGSVTVQVAQAASGSYAAATATATLTIAKKVLTVTADNKSKAFNTVNPALTITYSGFAYTDNAASLTTQATATTTALTASPAGPYPITPAGAASNNYTFTYVNGTLTINPASAPTITFNGASKVYSDVPFAMTATSNSAGALTYSIITGGAFASINATSGQVTILGAGSITVQVAQAANGSYTAGTATATLTIAKKVLTVTADNKSKAFNTVNPALTITYSGFAYADDAASLTTQATATTTALTASPAGPYPITPAGAASNNYTFTYVNGTLTIDPASTPTIALNGETKVYGDLPFAMTATSNSAGALTYSITAGGAFASINATSGQVTILGAGSVTVQVDQTADGSYSATSQTAVLTIDKAVLAATADPQSRVYNTANPALTITYTGFVYGENSSVITEPTTSTSATILSDVGAYPITLTGGSAANYTITLVDGTLTIAQATPTLVYTGPTSGLVGAILALTATTSSTATPTFSETDGTGKAFLSIFDLTLNAAGTVTVTISVAADGNYSAASITQIIIINPVGTNSLTSEDDGQGVKVYPNPSYGKFYISLDNFKGQNLSYRLINQTGREIVTKSLGKVNELQAKEEIELLSVVPGNYVLQIILDNKMFTEKMVIYGNKPKAK